MYVQILLASVTSSLPKEAQAVSSSDIEYVGNMDCKGHGAKAKGMEV